MYSVQIKNTEHEHGINNLYKQLYKAIAQTDIPGYGRDIDSSPHSDVINGKE